MEMTLQEKIEIQKYLASELFHLSGIKKINEGDREGNFFYEIMRKLFRVEMDYLGLKCFQKNPNNDDVKLEFVFEKNSGSAGSFSIDGEFDKNGGFVLEKPVIKINLGCELRDVLFGDFAELRVSAVYEMVDTLFHEIQHYRQYLLIQSGISNRESLRHAREEIFLRAFYKVYRINHDDFYGEADAQEYSHLFRKYYFKGESNLLSKEVDYRLEMFAATKEVAFILLPFKGYLDRDIGLGQQSDFIMKNNKNNRKFLEIFPILKKVYYPDGSKKSFSELITNYFKEIEDAKRNITDDDLKSSILDDTKKMYFELFNEIILSNNRVEIYEAVLNHGTQLVNQLLDELDLYNVMERTSKISALKRKLAKQSSKLADYNYLHGNNGLIDDPEDLGAGAKVLQVQAYAAVLSTRSIARGIDMKICAFFMTKGYYELLPVEGYYALKSGQKISIDKFTDECVIPRLEKVDEKEYVSELKKLLIDVTKPSCEVEYLFGCEKVNKDYQTKNNRYFELKSIPFLAGALKPEFKKKFNQNVINMMNLLLPICRYEKGATAFLEVLGDYSPEQCELIDGIVEAANLLTNEKSLNPSGLDYNARLRRNDQFMLCLQKRNNQSERGV